MASYVPTQHIYGGPRSFGEKALQTSEEQEEGVIWWKNNAYPRNCKAKYWRNKTRFSPKPVKKNCIIVKLMSGMCLYHDSKCHSVFFDELWI